jgi:O-antigen/teichoic acid export membrane protein
MCSFALPVAWGAVQGMSRFRLLGAVQVGYALLKLALGLVLAAAGAGVAGVMFGIGAASVAAVAATGVAVLPLVRAAAGRQRRKRALVTRYNLTAALAFAAFASVTTIDVIVARLSLPHDVAGAYSAASIGARVVLLVAAPVTTVLFPRVAAMRDLRRERRHLLGGVGAVALVAAPVVAVFWLVPGAILAVTFGHQYDAARAWLGPLALAMTLYAVVSVFQFHFLSLGRTTYVRLAVPVALLQIALFALFHRSPSDLVGVQLATAAVFVASSEVYERALLRRSTRAA